MPRSERREDRLDVTGVAPVAQPRLSDTIADRIRELIVTQDLAVGTRLPSERELADRFGVSRPTLSQAVRHLSLLGLVESRRGSGVYVVRRLDEEDAALVPSLLSASSGNLESLVELRLWLEGLGVQRAIDRGPEADIALARQALTRLTESVGETSSWIAADTMFHATVVGLAGNPALTTIYERVHTSLLEYEYRDWVANDEVPDWLAPTEAASQLALHEPIVEGLEAGDAAAALAACHRHNSVMREHLLSSR